MLGVFTTEKNSRALVGLRLEKTLLEKFRSLCKDERRDYNAQMEIILEEYFALREKNDSHEYLIRSGTKSLKKEEVKR